MNNLKKTLVILMCALIVLALVYIYANSNDRNNKSEDVITTGMTLGQNDYFSSKLSEATGMKRRLDEGKRLKEKGEYQGAIKVFEEVLNDADDRGFKGMAIIGISNTYEKKRDYNKALEFVILRRDKFVNDWAKEPVVERIKYLEYALQGNYEMSIKHAELAMQAEMKVHGSKKPREDYIDRLNDLKASKEYIESLKK